MPPREKITPAGPAVRPQGIRMPSRIRKVVILTHEAHPLESRRYFVRLLAEQWRARGIEVKELRGPDRFEDADVAVQHVNLTVVPDDYVSLARRYPVVVNDVVVDISKSVISGNLVGPGDGYAGPVIVKTDANFGGRPEEALHDAGGWATRMRGKLLGRLPWRSGRLTATTRTLKRYPIFPSLAAVPEAVFANPHLVVEKFLPEFRDGCYWLRNYLFLGDRHVGGMSASREPIVKSSNAIARETIPVPDELRAMRARLGFDYGKFDYVVHDGRIVLLDANRTPTYRGAVPSERVASIARTLAEGILAVGMRPELPGDRPDWPAAGKRCA